MTSVPAVWRTISSMPSLGCTWACRLVIQSQYFLCHGPTFRLTDRLLDAEEITGFRLSRSNSGQPPRRDLGRPFWFHTTR